MTEEASSIDRADIHTILQHIPHRYPFLLIDRLEGGAPHKWVRVVKNVSFGDWFFMGCDHTSAAMPQLLVLEALAQASGILCHYSGMMSKIGKSIIFFAGVEDCHFESDVRPGDALTLECRLKRTLRGVAKLDAEATVDGRRIASAALTAVIRDVGIE